jgi:catechol 2,3-dioxygenase-like lactoylglutathione lyase family enzyme
MLEQVMAIDHVSVGVGDMARAKRFYDAVLEPLGMKPVFPVEIAGKIVGVGYGEGPQPVFWIGLPINGKPASMGNGAHIAFSAASRAAVDAFYLAALANGGAEDGAPGLRTEYHPNYYGAFVRDPDGNKIEACRHAPD